MYVRVVLGPGGVLVLLNAVQVEACVVLACHNTGFIVHQWHLA